MGTSYFSENGKYVLNGNGGGVASTSDSLITGQWAQMNYVSPADFIALDRSYRAFRKGKGRDLDSFLKNLEALLRKDPFGENGGIIIGRRPPLDALDFVPQVFKSSKVVERDPVFGEIIPETIPLEE
jgi:hypothetical protein